MEALTSLSDDKALPIALVTACQTGDYVLDAATTLTDWAAFRRRQEDIRSLLRATGALCTSYKTVFAAIPDLDRVLFKKAVDADGVLHAGLVNDKNKIRQNTPEQPRPQNSPEQLKS